MSFSSARDVAERARARSHRRSLGRDVEQKCAVDWGQEPATLLDLVATLKAAAAVIATATSSAGPSCAISKSGRWRKTVTFVVSKSDSPLADQQIVTGVVLQPTMEMGTPDSQGDLYSAAEVEQAMYGFMANYRNLGLQHQAIINGKAIILENWIARENSIMNGQPIVKGTWLMSVKVLDADLWADIKRGEITGFSIGGSAQRTPLGGATQ